MEPEDLPVALVLESEPLAKAVPVLVLEEDRRLYYVACSRARRYLCITNAYNYHKGQYKIRGKLSRFADDPRTEELLQKAREPGKNPFFSINPQRIQQYYLTVAE